MQDLADELGLLRGSLYAHIGSKEELLFDVVDEGADRFLARGHEAVNYPGSAAHRLRAFLTGHVETAIDHIDAATVFLNEWRYLSPENRAIIKDKRDLYEELMRDIVAEGVARGEFRRDSDVRFAGLLVLSAANWVYEWYSPEGPLRPDAIAARFSELIVRGLEART